MNQELRAFSADKTWAVWHVDIPDSFVDRFKMILEALLKGTGMEVYDYKIIDDAGEEEGPRDVTAAIWIRYQLQKGEEENERQAFELAHGLTIPEDSIAAAALIVHAEWDWVFDAAQKGASSDASESTS